MDQFTLNELSEKYPDLGQLVCVQSDVWKEVLGEDWVKHNPEIPFFLAPDDVKGLKEQQGLQHGKLAMAVERVLSEERVFADHSDAAELIKAAYRLLLSGYFEDLPQRVDARLRASVEHPEEQAPAAILALNLWSEDPRKDEAAWFLWMMVGSAYLRSVDAARAAEYLSKAVELNPNSPEAANELGLAFALRQDYPNAETMFKKALALVPEDPSTLSHLGAVCLQRGRKAEALDYLERASLKKPGDDKIGKLLQLARVMKE